MDLDIFQPPPFFDPDVAEDVPSAVSSVDRRHPADRTALLRAHATLVAGCTFIIAHAGTNRGLKPHPAYARMTGNRLHELDRFLSVMIDEASALLEGPRPDARFFARMRNTPQKLGRLESMRDAHAVLGPRLDAIGRICAYLRHCREAIRWSSLADDILIVNGLAKDTVPEDGNPGQAGLDAATMVVIADLYRSMGNILLAAVDRANP